MRAAGITQVCVMDSECVTINDDYEGSPAIWRATDWLSGAGHSRNDLHNGFAAGCGNGQQYQCTNTWAYLGEDFSCKAYDVKTEQEIDRGPFESKFVVTKHDYPRRKYPFNC